MPFWEKAIGVLGLLLVLGVLSFFVYESLQPTTPPELVVEVTQIQKTEGGYLVEFAARNLGGSTAASVVVEGVLLPAADPAGEPVESSEITLDYIPESSMRQGGLLFVEDPAAYQLELHAKGYVTP